MFSFRGWLSCLNRGEHLWWIEDTLYADHGWHCAVQDVEMVHVTDDPKFNGDASTARCARFERDGDWPDEFHERWHVWSRDGFLPKGAKEWQSAD